jgi:Glycosyltransferase family 9 (heptosyltransferase)/Tetratricopeptide repeat
MQNTEQLIAQGNTYREQHLPEQALQQYATAMAADRGSSSAFNNYGNVLREIGDPAGAVPFLQRAIQLDPANVTHQFNLSVAYLLSGDYVRGWPAYEARHNFEHLKGTIPNYAWPVWNGEDLNGKTIFVRGEQGHGDIIQFVRFVQNLKNIGATVTVQVTNSLIPLIQSSEVGRNVRVIGYTEPPGDVFDYWVPIMSLPGKLNVRVDNLPTVIQYLTPDPALVADWRRNLGIKNKLRVGFAWSGRRDSWINQHKAMPFATILELIRSHVDYDWYNLQTDCTAEEEKELVSAGVHCFPGGVATFADTAALVANLDVVVSVDTATAHLAAALGKPTWVMLNNYAPCWRWLLNRDDTPWYATARLFRQPKMGDWNAVVEKIRLHLKLFKI